jgi:hypothetical protein
MDATSGIHVSEPINEGMTLRDYFAGQMLSSVFSAQMVNAPLFNTVAEAAYAMADAMLEARK